MASSALILILCCLMAVSAQLATAFIAESMTALKFHPALKDLPKGKQINSFDFTNCGGKNDSANITNISLLPDPLKFPGNISAAFTIDIIRKVTAGLEADVDVWLGSHGRWRKLECLLFIGSCKYDHVCRFLNNVFKGGCPESFYKHNIPCQCEKFTEGHYQLPLSTQEAPGITQDIPAGDYYIKLSLTDNKTPTACAAIKFTVA